MGGTARSGSHLPEQSGCRIRQFARTGSRVILSFGISIPLTNAKH